MVPPPALGHVSIHVEDTLAVIKYNRPKVGNALNGPILEDMLTALRWATMEPCLKVIVQSGEGKFFTTGMDLVDGGDLGDGPPDYTGLRELNRCLINTDKILIAAVNGPAAGYGVSSIALFDLVYSVPDAYFFTPFIKWGLGCEGGSSVTFPAILGRQKASSLIFAGDRLSAQELERAGMITKILPKVGFMDEVLAIARRIAESPSGALVDNKKLLMREMRPRLLEANDAEIEGLRARWMSLEPKEAIKAFMREREEKARKRSQQKL